MNWQSQISIKLTLEMHRIHLKLTIDWTEKGFGLKTVWYQILSWKTNLMIQNPVMENGGRARRIKDNWNAPFFRPIFDKIQSNFRQFYNFCNCIWLSRYKSMILKQPKSLELWFKYSKFWFRQKLIRRVGGVLVNVYTVLWPE